MYTLKKSCRTALLILSTASFLFAQDRNLRIDGTNPKYEEGDWISYGVTRFTTAVAVGLQFAYFGTAGGGLARYNFFSREWDFPFTTSNGLADNFVTAIAFDESNSYLWCATKTSIGYYQPASRRWQNTFKTNLGLSEYDDVVSIGVGEDDLLFVTAGGRQVAMNKYGGIGFPNNDGQGGGRKWYGQRAYERPPFPHYFISFGYFFEPEGFIKDTQLREAPITSAAKDRWSNIWMGTFRFGVLNGDIDTKHLELRPYGLYSPRVDAIGFDEDGVWFAGRNDEPEESGVTFWDQRRKEWRYFESQFNASILSDQVNRIKFDREKVYFANRFGINIYDKRRDRWTQITQGHGLVDEWVHDVEIAGDSLWAATDAGISLIQIHSINSDSLKIEEIARKHLISQPVFDVVAVEDTLWATTRLGIYRYEIKTGRGKFFGSAEGPYNNLVTCLARSGDEIWFGGEGSVEGYNFKNHQWLGLPERKDDLPGIVNAIAADDDAVWAGTDSGLYKFNRKERFWRVFTRIDGLLDNRVLALELDGDYIWIGAPEGATVFYWNDPYRID